MHFSAYISMGEKSNLMFTTGMAGFCFVSFLRTRKTVRISFPGNHLKVPFYALLSPLECFDIFFYFILRWLTKGLRVPQEPYLNFWVLRFEVGLLILAKPAPVPLPGIREPLVTYLKMKEKLCLNNQPGSKTWRKEFSNGFPGCWERNAHRVPGS